MVAAAGAFPEIVREECGLLFPPNDSLAMARAVRELFSHDTGQMGRLARQHVEQRYAWDTVVSGLLEHYRAVLGSNFSVPVHA
ncbi:hypothetical protein D3C76_1513770 [compost metagenome]